MTPDRLSPAFCFKAAGIDEAGVFTGLASTFGGPRDAYGDVIAPGAFAGTLAEHAKNGSMLGLLWAHELSEPIGRWLTLKESREGLEAAGNLTLETKRGAEAYALMKDRALGLSIGFVIPPGGAAYERDGTRTIKKIQPSRSPRWRCREDEPVPTPPVGVAPAFLSTDQRAAWDEDRRCRGAGGLDGDGSIHPRAGGDSARGIPLWSALFGRQGHRASPDVGGTRLHACRPKSGVRSSGAQEVGPSRSARRRGIRTHRPPAMTHDSPVELPPALRRSPTGARARRRARGGRSHRGALE
jgi:HK97 family phage prohead protease